MFINYTAIYWFSRALLLGYLLTLHGTCVRAQIVNIEDKRANYDSIGWYGYVGLAANLTKNKSQVVNLSGDIRLDRQGKKSDILLLSNYRLIRVEKSNALNSGFLHARYGYKIGKKWQLEVFSQIQYDQRISLNLRELMGIGMRAKLFETLQGRAFLGIHYMYEYDELSNVNITFRDHRISSFLSLQQKFSDQAKLSLTAYLQPHVKYISYTRVSLVSSLNITLHKRFAFISSFNLTSDSRIHDILPDVPITTYTWNNGLRYNL